MILFDASNAQTASRWKSDSLLSQPEKGHASRDGFQSGQTVAAGDGFVASPILSRANSSLASKRAEVSDAEMVVHAPSQDNENLQGGSSGSFQSDPLLNRQPGSSQREVPAEVADKQAAPSPATAGAVPSQASAEQAQDQADAENASDPMLMDAALEALSQAGQQSASNSDAENAAGDTGDSATLDADAEHGANNAAPDNNDNNDGAGSELDANVASAVSPASSPAETTDKAAAVPAGHRLVSEQVLAGAMARERAMGRQQGMAEGRAAASASAEEEVQQLRSVLQGLQASLSDTQRLFEPMQRLALHLAEQLVRGELEFSSRAIRRLIESALLEVDQKLAFSVRLNPEDLQLLRTTLGEDDAMHMAGDPALSRGSVRVEMDDGVVEDLIEHRLDTLARSLLGPEVKPHVSVLSRSNLHQPANALPAQQVNPSHAVSHAVAVGLSHTSGHAAVHTPGVEPGLTRQDWTPPFARHEVSDIEPVAAVEPVHGYPYGD